MKPTSRNDRFWSKVDIAGPGECWCWTAALSRGYGVFWLEGTRTVKAYRFAYELSIGPVPDGLDLDHLCRNRACCNPAHLEPVTRRENVLRGQSPQAQNARKTHCKNGHEFTPENTLRSGRGRRLCRTCNRDRCRNRRRA